MSEPGAWWRWCSAASALGAGWTASLGCRRARGRGGWGVGCRLVPGLPCGCCDVPTPLRGQLSRRSTGPRLDLRPLADTLRPDSTYPKEQVGRDDGNANGRLQPPAPAGLVSVALSHALCSPDTPSLQHHVAFSANRSLAFEPYVEADTVSGRPQLTLTPPSSCRYCSTSGHGATHASRSRRTSRA